MISLLWYKMHLRHSLADLMNLPEQLGPERWKEKEIKLHQYLQLAMFLF